MGVTGRKSAAEIYGTNMSGSWTISHTNRLGFLDREPSSPEWAATSCHVAMIGSSFVEAKEVPIPEKCHTRLETLAARPSALLGRHHVGFRARKRRTDQLTPYYDKFVRRPLPKLGVFVISSTDFLSNSGLTRFLVD